MECVLSESRCSPGICAPLSLQASFKEGLRNTAAQAAGKKWDMDNGICVKLHKESGQLAEFTIYPRRKHPPLVLRQISAICGAQCVADEETSAASQPASLKYFILISPYRKTNLRHRLCTEM